MFKMILEKIYNFLEDKRIERMIRNGDLVLTDRGKYFFKYCEDLIADPDIQHIDAYDDDIFDMAERYNMTFDEMVDTIVSTKFIMDVNDQDQ